MFKAIKDNKIIAINETGRFPCLVHDSVMEDTEHTCIDYVNIGGEYVLYDDIRAIDLKKNEVREIRNRYLDETDKYTSIPDFPIDSETKEKYIEYRQYLRDYTKIDNWWEQQPKTFEEWRENEES